MPAEEFDPTPRNVTDRHAELVASHKKAAEALDSPRVRELEAIVERYKINLENLKLVEAATPNEKIASLRELINRKLPASEEDYEALRETYSLVLDLTESLVGQFLTDNQILNTTPTPRFNLSAQDLEATGFIPEEGLHGDVVWRKTEGSIATLMPSIATELLNERQSTHDLDKVIEAIRSDADNLGSDVEELDSLKANLNDLSDYSGELDRRLHRGERKELSEATMHALADAVPQIRKTYELKIGDASRILGNIDNSDGTVEKRYHEEDALTAARRHAERYMGQLHNAALAEAALDGIQINRDDAVKLK